MKPIDESLKETILKEGRKNSSEKQLKEFQKVLDEMKKSGQIQKPNYTLPLVDTIGKTYYSILNKKY